MSRARLKALRAGRRTTVSLNAANAVVVRRAATLCTTQAGLEKMACLIGGSCVEEERHDSS
jgi:hypothetical protein